jgi:hypothetical protein
MDFGIVVIDGGGKVADDGVGSGVEVGEQADRVNTIIIEM